MRELDELWRGWMLDVPVLITAAFAERENICFFFIRFTVMQPGGVLLVSVSPDDSWGRSFKCAKIVFSSKYETHEGRVVENWSKEDK